MRRRGVRIGLPATLPLWRNPNPEPNFGEDVVQLLLRRRSGPAFVIEPEGFVVPLPVCREPKRETDPALQGGFNHFAFRLSRHTGLLRSGAGGGLATNGPGF